jgi:photosystem II stability/assembly factor-like uncharacterized protein
VENTLILATRNGIVICEKDGEQWVEALRGLSGHEVTSVTARGGVIAAGTREGVFISEDYGNKWTTQNSGLTTKHIRWLERYPGVPELMFAGTEPAGIFVSYEGGRAWRGCPEVAQMREKFGWQLPYSPNAGCVRDFAFLGLRGYAAVEDGAVLVSGDSGENWSLAGGSTGSSNHNPTGGTVHSDVHSIEVHPSSTNLVFAATGGGLYRSSDGGSQWVLLYKCYARAVWIDPQNSNFILLGPADGVDYNGRIEASRDGGQSWEPAAQGWATPWNNHMVERFLSIGSELLAVLSNGELYSTHLEELAWGRILPDTKGVEAAASMGD